MDIKEFLERVRLTDEEALDLLGITVLPRADEAMIMLQEDMRFVGKIAQAQLNKVLKEDLAWIDREKKIPETKLDGTWVMWAEIQKNKMLKAGFTHSVIPLREAIKEAQE